MEAQLRRWLPVLLVAAGLVIAAVAAAGPGLSGGTLPPRAEEGLLAEPEESPEPAGTLGPAARPVEEFVHTEYPGWLSWPVTIFFLALAAGAVGLVLYLTGRYLFTERVVRRQLRGQAASQPEGALAAEEVRDALRAGLADIDAGGDPRRAVIACWLRLERTAAAAGTARLAADTPADLVARLLAAHRVSDQALARLADAYRLARYAPAEVDDALLGSARQALADVAAQLAGRLPAERGR